jgi:hypothetical protein
MPFDCGYNTSHRQAELYHAGGISMGYGIIGVLVLVLDIYVIMQILQGGGDSGKKLLWIIIVLLLPLLGPILYYALGKA